MTVELQRGPGGEAEAQGPGEAWALVVEDDGPGIPPSLGATALEPLERGTGGGDGLGLAIVARVAQALGGAVTVEEARPGGSAPDRVGQNPHAIQGIAWPGDAAAAGRGCRVMLRWGTAGRG